MSTKKLQILDSLIKQAQNADTVDGMHASEFAVASDVEQLKNQVNDIQENAYNDAEVRELISTNASDITALENLVGDTKVAVQISNAINAIDYPVDSVNGKTGTVVLTATDVGAQPAGNYLTEESDPTVPAWAKADTKPTYTASEVGALPASTVIPSIEGLATEDYVDDKIGDVNITLDNKVDKVSGKGLSTNDYTTTEKNKLAGIADGANKTVVDSALSSTSTNPVQNKAVNEAISNLNTLVGDKSVASQISTAIANKSDIGHTHTASEIGADVEGSAASALSDAKSYTDTKISNLINSAPTTLDTLGEIATAMEENADVVAALETSIGTKANATDLTSHTSNKSNPHGVTVAQIGAVPTSRTVNGKALSANITLSATDVGADVSGAANTALTNAKAYTDAEITEWVGDEKVSEQITAAIANKADSGHTHDDRYYTESEINTKLSGKSDTSHTHSAYVNQNAFSNVTVGSTTIAADSATDTITLVAGNNVTITPDATNDKVTIAATDTIYTHPNSGVTAGTYKSVTVNAQGHVTGGSNPTTLSGYGITDAATKTELNTLSGLVGDTAVSEQIDEAFDEAITGLSVSGKTITYTKGDGSTGTITTQDTNTVYTHPTYTAKNSGLYKVTVDGTGHVSGTAAVAKSDITALGIPAQDTTYSAATTSAAGLMSASDKSKLDGIATGANKTTVDSSLSTTSTNPVQNKVVNAAISNLNTLVGDTAVSTQISSAVAVKLDKTTYEYNKELALGSTGKVCIGKFPMYDSNISVEIKSTTNTTYNGTLIIATQNINTTAGGSYTATVYGDASNSLTNSIKIHYGSGSNVFSVYIDLPGWSKNLLHIQCVSLAGAPTDIATTVSEIPSNATIIPTNALKAQLDTKAASSHGTHVTYSTTAPVMDGTASVGSAATVARSDHKHPTDTSRAAASDLTALQGLVGDTKVSTQISNAIASKADSSHTHNYAGSSSAGGAATSANKLNTDAGSATNPVYFSNGVPVKTTYTLGASVPSGAKFTDTVYTHPTTSGNKHIPSGGSSGQILRWSAAGTAVWGADNNTTYSAGTGMSLSGTTFNHSNSISAATVSGGSGNLAFGGSFLIPKITYDSEGHITSTGSTGCILPSNAATTSTAGLMSAADKTKLDNTPTVIAFYGVALTFSSNQATYSDSRIKANSVIVCSRRAGSKQSDIFSVNPAAGSVTISSTATTSGTINVNIIVVNN